MAEEFAPLRAEGGQQRVAVVELFERPAVPRDEAGRFEVGVLFAPILPARIQVEEVDDGELREFQEEVQEKRRHRAYPNTVTRSGSAPGGTARSRKNSEK